MQLDIKKVVLYISYHLPMLIALSNYVSKPLKDFMHNIFIALIKPPGLLYVCCQFLPLSVVRNITARITSYNVCYTKLLRIVELTISVGNSPANGFTFFTKVLSFWGTLIFIPLAIAESSCMRIRNNFV